MKDAMIYKGYVGSVRFNAADDVFYGKLEGIDALISFEGSSVQQLKKAFHEAVDDYLEHCKAMGREPKKPLRGSFNVRIKPELHRLAMMRAAKAGITLNQLVQKAIEETVSHN